MGGPQPLFDGGYSPVTNNGKTKHNNKAGGCSTNCLLGTLIVLAAIGVIMFGIFMFAMYRNGPALEATTSATVGMRVDMVRMQKNAKQSFETFRANFPINQEEITTKQVLDSIDKAHGILAWANDLKNRVSPAMIGSLVGNITTVMYNVNSMFIPAAGETHQQRSNELIGNAALVVQKIGTLVNTITPAEFHAAFMQGQSALGEATKLITTVNHQPVAEMMQKISDVLGAADSEHIIQSITNTSKGLNEVIDRFTHDGGISISLPISGGKGGK